MFRHRERFRTTTAAICVSANAAPGSNSEGFASCLWMSGPIVSWAEQLPPFSYRAYHAYHATHLALLPPPSARLAEHLGARIMIGSRRESHRLRL